MKLKMTRSSGNVFRDVGFTPVEAEHLLVRADLMIKVQTLIESKHLSQAELAKSLGITKPRLSDLLRGRIDLFSTDTLIDILARLGVRVRLVLKPLRHGLKAA
ncbi:MAG: XRE family transcriptional regulator [Deltaproteobacteria bacterium]|nr:XRE family transcriptional regulator [Deltaproteobacteria bacterium]